MVKTKALWILSNFERCLLLLQFGAAEPWYNDNATKWIKQNIFLGIHFQFFSKKYKRPFNHQCPRQFLDKRSVSFVTGFANSSGLFNLPKTEVDGVYFCFSQPRDSQCTRSLGHTSLICFPSIVFAHLLMKNTTERLRFLFKISVVVFLLPTVL